MRIIIGGEDDVAFRLAEALMVDHDVTVLCPEHAKDPRSDRLDVDFQFGEINSSDDLKEAGAARSDLFVACTPYDERNLVACASAKGLGAARTVCFMRGQAVQSSVEEVRSLADTLHIDSIVLPAERLAREILRIVAVPGALDVEAFAGGRVRLVKQRVEEGSPITRAPLRDVGVPKGVVLVMARREEEIFVPKGDTWFQPGDQITAMGNLVGINRFLYRYLTPRGRRQSRRATVVGGGVVGFAVAEGLTAAGWEVKVIESDRERAEEIAQQLDCLVLHGDGADLDLLREERIDEHSVLVAVTSNDEKNLLVSLLGKHLGVKRIITRADQQVNERLFEKVGIDVVRSARGAAIDAVLRSVRVRETDLMAELEHGDVVVLHSEVPEDREPIELSELQGPALSIVGAILRGRKVIIPHGHDEVRGGDRLLVFCAKEDEDKVRHFFGRAGS